MPNPFDQFDQGNPFDQFDSGVQKLNPTKPFLQRLGEGVGQASGQMMGALEQAAYPVAEFVHKGLYNLNRVGRMQDKPDTVFRIGPDITELKETPAYRPLRVGESVLPDQLTMPTELQQIQQGGPSDFQKLAMGATTPANLASMGVGAKFEALRPLIAYLYGTLGAGQAVGDVTTAMTQPEQRHEALGRLPIDLAMTQIREGGPGPTGVKPEFPQTIRMGEPELPFSMPNRPPIQLPDVQKFQETPPLIGQRPLDIQQPIVGPYQVTPGQTISIPDVAAKPVEGLGGQVSFAAPAEVGAIPSARQATARVKPGEQEALMQGGYVPATEVQRMHSGIDPTEFWKDLRPAVMIDGKLVEGARGETHADILIRNGKDPESPEYNHFSKNRGFASDFFPGKLVDRNTAQSISGRPGSAEAGGTDSMDLAGGQNAVRELRTDSLSKAQPSRDIQKVEEEVRSGTGAAREVQTEIFPQKELRAKSEFAKMRQAAEGDQRVIEEAKRQEIRSAEGRQDLYAGIDLGKLFPGQRQDFRYKELLKFPAAAPEWLRKAKVEREAQYQGYAASPGLYQQMKQQTDPYFDPKSNWFRHAEDQPGVVFHKQTGKPYFAMIKPEVASERFTVDGKPATPEQVKAIKQFSREDRPTGFRVFDLGKAEVEKGTGVKKSGEFGGQVYSGIPITDPAELKRVLVNNPNANKFEKPGRYAGGLEKTMQAARTADVALSPWDVIYDWMDGGKGGYNGPLTKQIREPLDSAYNEGLKARDAVEQPYKDYIKSNKLSREDSNAVEILLSKRSELLDKGVSPEEIKRTVDNITPEQRTLARMIQKTYADAKEEWKFTGNGAFANVNRLIEDSTRTEATGKLVDRLMKVVDSKEFADTYGRWGQSLIKEHLDLVKSGSRGNRIAALDWLRRQTSRGIIAYRLPSQFVHMANVPLAMQRAGPVWWTKGLNESLTEVGDAFLREHFAETFERGGGEGSLRELEKRLGETTLDKATRYGFSIQRFIDQKNAQATVLGVYMKALKDKGLDPNEYANLPVDQEAVGRARVLARRAVASPLAKDVPPVITRGGSISRSLMQFQNTFLDQWSNIKYDLLQTGLPKAITGDPMQAATMAAALATMLLVETSIKYSYKQGLEKATGREPNEKDTYDSELVKEALRRVPGMGQLSSAVTYGGTGIPSIDVLLEPAKAVGKALKEPSESRKKLALLRGATSAAELAVPGASQIGDVVRYKMEAEMYKPHTKRLEEQTGKSVDEMDLRERVRAEGRFKATQPKGSPDAAAAAVKAQVNRGQKLTESLDKTDQNFLKSRGLVLPGYDNKLNVGGEKVYLTKEESTTFDGYVKEEVTRAIDKMRNDVRFAQGTPEYQEKYFDNVISAAKERARGRMINDIKKPKKQRYSFRGRRDTSDTP